MTIDDTTSVIIPVLNDSQSLMRCLGGISQQSYPASHIQVIVVDNGSSPAIEIEDNYSFSLQTLRCETPGSYAARNAGAAAANGNVIVFIDADCIPEQDWLAEGVAALNRESGQCIVGGEVTLLPPEPPTGVGMYQFLVGFQQEKNIRLKHFTATANLFCRAAHFDTVGPFHQHLLSGGDREWSWRAGKMGFKIQFAPRSIVCTSPRTSLRAAIHQARRVAAGRKHLSKLALLHLGREPAQPYRRGFAAVQWLWSHSELRRLERIRVIFAAVTIRAVVSLEKIRLMLGGRAERR